MIDPERKAIEIDFGKHKREAEKAWVESGESQRNADMLAANLMTPQMAIHKLTEQVKRIADSTNR